MNRQYFSRIIHLHVGRCDKDSMIFRKRIFRKEKSENLRNFCSQRAGGLLSRRLQASFTVEASLLMTLILPAVLAILLAGFYVHDRVMLQGGACELAAMGSNLRTFQARASMLEERKRAVTSGGSLWTRNISGNASAGKDQSEVGFSGSFPIPGMVMQLYTSGELTVSGEWNRKLYHPANTIRKIRGLKYLIDEWGET